MIMMSGLLVIIDYNRIFRGMCTGVIDPHITLRVCITSVTDNADRAGRISMNDFAAIQIFMQGFGIRER